MSVHHWPRRPSLAERTLTTAARYRPQPNGYVNRRTDCESGGREGDVSRQFTGLGKTMRLKASKRKNRVFFILVFDAFCILRVKKAIPSAGVSFKACRLGDGVSWSQAPLRLSCAGAVEVPKLCAIVLTRSLATGVDSIYVSRHPAQ